MPAGRYWRSGQGRGARAQAGPANSGVKCWQFRVVEWGVRGVSGQEMAVVVRWQRRQSGMATTAVSVMHNGFGRSRLQRIEQLAKAWGQGIRAAT